MTLIAEPRVTAALMGEMIKKMGADRVCWGTDAVWTGSPQWQIEGLRRFRSPRTCRREITVTRRSGRPLARLKSAIFASNNAKLYNIEIKKADLELKKISSQR